MKNFLEVCNLFLGMYCLSGSISGIVNEEWTKTCAFCLFWIAFEQAIEYKGKK